jgi:hypothetical protein
MPDKAIICYICSCICVLLLQWLSLWELWGIWLVDIVVLPMRLQTPSTPSVFSLTPLLGTQCSVQWLAASICLCIYKALVGPLRRQLYRAPVSMYFLASAIVSGFGNWIFFKDLFILHIWLHCHSLQTHQKRASDAIIIDGCEPPCKC